MFERDAFIKKKIKIYVHGKKPRHVIVYNSYFFPMKIMRASRNLNLEKTPANQFASAPKHSCDTSFKLQKYSNIRKKPGFTQGLLFTNLLPMPVRPGSCQEASHEGPWSLGGWGRRALCSRVP